MRSAGFAVRVFASAEEFLSCIGPELHGCVIVDLHMPGMGGLELQQALSRQCAAAIPVIILSAHEDDDLREQVLAAGAAMFLKKPNDDQVLLAAVSAALDTKNRRC